MDLSRNINLFEGQFGVNAQGRGSFGVDMANVNEPYNRDLVYRHEGLERAIMGHTTVITALNSNIGVRNGYIAAKRLDLNRIAGNLRDLFVMEYRRNLESGFTQDKSKEKAKKMANEFKVRALKQHNSRYPEDFKYEEVMRLLDVKKKEPKEK